MAAFGTRADRLADRMPKARIQATESQRQDEAAMTQSVRDAMMYDLGTLRIDELPLDNTHHERHIPQRSRQHPIIKERSETLEGFRALAENGMNDSEALAVKSLADLGGPCVYRSTAETTIGRTKNRRPGASELQTSANGIVISEGVEVRRFVPKKTNLEVSAIRATAAKPMATMQLPAAASPSESHLPKSLPPHLRTKKDLGSQPSAGSPMQVRENPTAFSAVKKPQDEASLTTQVRDGAQIIASTEPMSEGKAGKKDPMEWSGSCNMMIPGKPSEFQEIHMKLRLVTTANNRIGEPVFIMKHDQHPATSHSLESFAVSYQKDERLIINFGPSEIQGSREVRYHLKFHQAEDTKAFVSHAEKLQVVTNYFKKMSNDEIPKPEPAPRQTHEPAVTASEPVSGPLDTPKELPPREIPQLKKTITNSTKEDGGKFADAFGKLSLSKVKTSNMYKSDRQEKSRCQYTAEELLEQRSAAKVPPGIEDVETPVKKQKIPPHLRNRQQNNVANLQAGQEQAKVCQEWLAGATGTQDQNTPDKQASYELERTAASTTTTSVQAQSSGSEIRTETTVVNETITATATSEVAIQTESDADPVVDEASKFHQSVQSKDIMPVAKSVNDVAVTIDRPIEARIETAKSLNAVEERNAPIATVDEPVENPASAVVDKTGQQGTFDSAKLSATAATETSTQPTAKASPEVHVKPFFGQQASTENIDGMPSLMGRPQMSVPHTVPSQLFNIPQVHAHQVMPGLPHLPSTGLIHAVSITYHISHADGSETTQHSTVEQPAIPNVNANFNHHYNTGTFSPSAQPFQPRTQGQVPRSVEPRFRRGLESSIFATGYSGAKFAGSFTGKSAA